MEEDRDNVEDRDSVEGVFDCVVASEVVEHVRDVDTFVGHLSKLVKVLGEDREVLLANSSYSRYYN